MSIFFRKKAKKKIFVALSGGVDSAVAAYLLKKEGHEVYGGFIRGYNVDGCQDRDAADAAKVAAHLGIPFYAFDLEKEYKQRVVEYLLEGYKKGITPNPDVVCNTEIKFGLFYEQVMRLGAEAVASGHYAITKCEKNGECALYASKDKNKDQSYFLWNVPQERLAHILFPAGKLTKPQVRKIARKAALPNAEKKDSQGVCFLGQFDFNQFLREHLGAQEGDVLSPEGKVIGRHSGVHLYTIGQRHGFQNFTNEPLFVIAKDVAHNTLTAVHEGNKNLLTSEFIVSADRFPHDGSVRAWGRCRYRQPLFRCFIERKGAHVLVRLPKPEKILPAAGQSFVAYNQKGKVLGGGIIEGYGV
jgi:tRNA-specific 2-thiouridylase